MIVYNKAYKATKEGLEAIGDVTDPPAPEKVDLTPEERELKEKKIRNWAKICIDEGKWTREAVDEFLQKRFGRCLDVTLPESRYAGMHRFNRPAAGGESGNARSSRSARYEGRGSPGFLLHKRPLRTARRTFLRSTCRVPSGAEVERSD